MLGGSTLCGSEPFAPVVDVIPVALTGLPLESAMLDLRDGPVVGTLGDMVCVLYRGCLGEFRLDLREMLAVPLATASGDVISLPPLETNLVCRLGEGLLTEGRRGRISSLSGELARGGLLAVFALYIVWS